MNKINNMSNFIGFSFDISRYTDFQQRVKLIALAVISGTVIGCYFICSFWSNRHVKHANGHIKHNNKILPQETPAIKSKLEMTPIALSSWNNLIQQKTAERNQKPGDTLPDVVIGCDFGLSIDQQLELKIRSIFRKLYEFGRSQEPEAPRIYSTLKTFIFRNKAVPYHILIRIINPSDLNYLQKNDPVALNIKDCLSKGVHYYDRKQDLTLSEEFVNSFTDKLNKIPTPNLDDKKLKRFVLQIIEGMEQAINYHDLYLSQRGLEFKNGVLVVKDMIPVE